MNLSDIFGTHSVFCFCGAEHLAINMRTYITEGLNNNELVCISIEPTLYGEMLRKTPNLPTQRLANGEMPELVAAFQAGGEAGLREEVKRRTGLAMEMGYSGLRCIWQPSVVMEGLSLPEWLCWEESLTEALAGTRCSILCLADIMDMIRNRGQDHEQIRDLLQVHPYMLYKMHLEEIASLRV